MLFFFFWKIKLIRDYKDKVFVSSGNCDCKMFTLDGKNLLEWQMQIKDFCVMKSEENEIYLTAAGEKPSSCFFT